MGKAKRLQPITEQKLINKLKKGTTWLELLTTYNVNSQTLMDMIAKLKDNYYNIKYSSQKLIIDTNMGGENIDYIDISQLSTQTVKFGLVGDFHLNSIYCREDFINAMYDIFLKEGVKTVYDAGNWIDGTFRFNTSKILNHTVDQQIDYAVKKYPARKGIITKFVSGDDHEGWYQKQGLNIGKYFEAKAIEAGRKDLVFQGYLQATTKIDCGEGSFKLLNCHGGGGSSYAISYKSQKFIEAMEHYSDLRPNLVNLGHYHKLEYLPNYNGVHIFQPGSGMEQSDFLKKLNIKSTLGGWVVEVYLQPNGQPWKVKTEAIIGEALGFRSNNKFYQVNTNMGNNNE